MKARLFTLIFMFVTLTASAQNDMKARLAYEDAETAVAAEDYQTAIAHLVQAEKLLAKWTPKVGYLMIISIDRIVDYDSPKMSQIKQLREQLDQYMQYVQGAANIPEDKFREVNEIDDFLKIQEIRYSDASDADYKSALLLMKNFRDDAQIGEAIVLLKKAIAKGNISAIYKLATIYAGSAKFKNNEEAGRLFKEAAEKGNTDAMNALAGRVEKEESIQLYHRALRYGNADDVALYMTSINAKKMEETVPLIHKAAVRGSVAAMEYLASVVYQHGIGEFQESGQEVQRWFHKAIDKGSVSALIGLGEFFEKRGNLDEALKYFQQAYEKKYWQSDWSLARTYYKKNIYDKSLVHYESALNSDMVDYILKNDDLLQIADSYYKTKNYSKSMSFYMKAYEKGNSQQKSTAKTAIAQMYEAGLGVEKNKKIAKEWNDKEA